MRLHNIALWFAVTLMAGFSLGCGDSNLGEVSGKVTLDGAPLPDAMLVFTPVAGGRPAAGRTDSQGEYQLVYSRDEEGAMLGEHVVEITTGDEIVNEDDTVTQVPEKVPAKYNANSELRAVIEAGENEFNFDLKTDGEIIQEQEFDG